MFRNWSVALALDDWLEDAAAGALVGLATVVVEAAADVGAGAAVPETDVAAGALVGAGDGGLALEGAWLHAAISPELMAADPMSKNLRRDT